MGYCHHPPISGSVVLVVLVVVVVYRCANSEKLDFTSNFPILTPFTFDKQSLSI